MFSYLFDQSLRFMDRNTTQRKERGGIDKFLIYRNEYQRTSTEILIYSESHINSVYLVILVYWKLLSFLPFPSILKGDNLKKLNEVNLLATPSLKANFINLLQCSHRQGRWIFCKKNCQLHHGRILFYFFLNNLLWLTHACRKNRGKKFSCELLNRKLLWSAFRLFIRKQTISAMRLNPICRPSKIIRLDGFKVFWGNFFYINNKTHHKGK